MNIKQIKNDLFFKRIPCCRYVEMFGNIKRLLSYPGYLTPKDFEEMMALKKSVYENAHFQLTTSLLFCSEHIRGNR